MFRFRLTPSQGIDLCVRKADIAFSPITGFYVVFVAVIEVSEMLGAERNEAEEISPREVKRMCPNLKLPMHNRIRSYL